MAILFIVPFTYRNDCSGGLCCVVFHFVPIEGAVEVLFGIPVAYAVFVLFPRVLPARQSDCCFDTLATAWITHSGCWRESGCSYLLACFLPVDCVYKAAILFLDY